MSFTHKVVGKILGDKHSKNMANPSAVFAASRGLPYTITNGPGGQSGYVTLPSGERVEAWKYYRDNRGSISVPNPRPTKKPASQPPTLYKRPGSVYATAPSPVAAMFKKSNSIYK